MLSTLMRILLIIIVICGGASVINAFVSHQVLGLLLCMLWGGFVGFTAILLTED